MNTKPYIIALSVLLSGCAAKTGSVRTNTDYDESYTGSPCFDGVLVNIKAAGCSSARLFTVPMTQTVKIQCVEKSHENEWTTHSFYMVPRGEHYEREGLTFLCADPLLIAGFVDENNQSQGGQGE